MKAFTKYLAVTFLATLPCSEGVTNTPAWSGEMMSLQGGCFNMGRSPQESEALSQRMRMETQLKAYYRGIWDEKDERFHEVCVEPFLLSNKEVTVSDFRRFVSATGYKTDAERNVQEKGCWGYKTDSIKKAPKYRKGLNWRLRSLKSEQENDHPVACVSWNDVMAYIEWLNRNSEGGYRLPTEAEWEYAARAGSEEAMFWGNNPDEACDYANVADRGWRVPHECEDGFLFTSPVGSYLPNDYGLYDMLGNVWEWTCSAYEQSYLGGETRCTDEQDTGLRVFRGGAYGIGPFKVRSAQRVANYTWGRNAFTGFRIARDD